MHELPTYCLLPLVGLNFKNFGLYKNSSNLKSTKINVKTLKLICEVYSLSVLPDKVKKVDRYVGINGNILTYDFPKRLRITLKAFVAGNYSKIPSSIKEYIVKHSGVSKEHEFILGLHKDSALKLKLEQELKVTIEEDAELLQAPKEEWFVT